VKGTDQNRVGPLRLVGSGLVPAARVKRAAFACFGVAALSGLCLASATSWWLLAIGAAAILAAWGYTGGPKPYGYLGLGELFVFVFFGLVATVGTVYLQTGSTPLVAWVAGAAAGFASVALLEANNLRDVAGDTVANKRTLAVRLGRARGAFLYLGAWVLVALGIVVTAALLASRNAHHVVAAAVPACPGGHPCTVVRMGNRPLGVHAWWALLGLVGMLGLGRIVRLVRSDAEGRALLPLLGATGKAQLRTGLLFALGIIIATAHWPA
jgi:1,4-dihydroxy-2-naphthoate octaprenyltransferase